MATLIEQTVYMSGYSNIYEKYQEKCNTPSDINELLPFLKEYAEKCEHITEMGTRRAVSTYAFLVVKPKKLVCYDFARWEDVDGLEIDAKECGVPLEFHEQDVLDADIEETDLLFIDTWHGELQLKAELNRHANKVRKYLIFHDTQTYRFEQEPMYPGVNLEFNNGRGLWYAIEDFLVNNPSWKIVFETKINNGLTVIQRNG